MKEIESKSRRKLARGTFYNMLSKLIYLFCGYIIYIVIGRVLGPNNYGIFGVVFALLNIVYLFLKSGVPQSTAKYIAGDESNAYPVMMAALRIQLLWAIFDPFLNCQHQNANRSKHYFHAALAHSVWSTCL